MNHYPLDKYNQNQLTYSVGDELSNGYCYPGDKSVSIGLALLKPVEIQWIVLLILWKTGARF